MTHNACLSVWGHEYLGSHSLQAMCVIADAYK